MLSPDWSHSSAAGLGAQSRGEGEAGAGSCPQSPAGGFCPCSLCREGLMLFKFMAWLQVAGGSFGVQLSCTMLAAAPQQMILDLLQSPVSSDK